MSNNSKTSRRLFLVCLVVGITNRTLGSIFFGPSMVVQCTELPPETNSPPGSLDNTVDELSHKKRRRIPFIKRLDNGESPSDQTSTHRTRFVAECKMPSIFGNFRMRSYIYSSAKQQLEPIVMISGDIKNRDNVLVRIHDQCFTSEVLGSLRCDCREQLHESLNKINEEGGIIIYLQQEGRGIGLANKIAAYSLQDRGLDTVDANLNLGFNEELREYNVVPDILYDLGIKSIRLLTNNPFKIDQLNNLGVKINKRIPLQISSNIHNEKYLRSKRDRMSHILDFEPEPLKTAIKLAGGSSSSFYTSSFVPSLSTPSSSPPTTHLVNSETEISIDTTTSTTILSDDNNNISPINIQPAVVTDENNCILGTSPSNYIFGKSSVEAAISAVRDGKIVVVVDDENRENEGDLIMASEKATPESVGFFVRYTSGLICVSLEGSRLDELQLPPMVLLNEDPKQTAYSISVDCIHNTTTGISAFDRATTFRALANPEMKTKDFQRPGHVFPLRYSEGGVLTRGGHTEASLDLARLAGLFPSGILAEIVDDSGALIRLDGLKDFAKYHNLVLTSVQDLVAYRKEQEGGPLF